MIEDYIAYERDRWADPSKNRYTLQFSATRDTVGEEPVEFNSLRYHDADYVSALAICGVMGKVQSAYANAQAEFIGLAPSDQTPSRLGKMILEQMVSDAPEVVDAVMHARARSGT